ncbi:LysR family transcriptional regulator, partial [Fusobacterium gastrosuis]|uniref:LysR family transcriptional regulator n=1 Tax=Fusobacterium gastrosuis TaxID=1755100 RepID=UPI003458C9A4
MLYIYMIYKEGSFSKAAEKLYLTQSALSMAIQKIERELKTPLLDRSKRPI